MLLNQQAESQGRMHSGIFPDSDLEATACPLCSATTPSLLHVFGSVKAVRCKDCGVVYLNPRLKEEVIKRIYRDLCYFEGGAGGYQEYVSQEKALRFTFRKFLGEMKKRGLVSGARLLEIGCGFGYLLDEARFFFPERTGLELSRDAASRAKALSDAEVYIGGIEDLPRGLGEFDVIAAVNVIEHVYSPLKFLSAAKDRLKSRGKIVIATPDIGSFWYRIMGGRWPSFKVPEHVVLYSGTTLARMLSLAGFGNIREIPFPHAFSLGLIAGKLRIPVPGALERLPLWIPKTMAAFSGEKRE